MSSNLKRIICGCFQDFEVGISFLDSKPDVSPWIIVKLIDAVFRGMAQVCFANNPISGLLCLIAFVLADPLVALASVVASVAAILASIALDQSEVNIKNGTNQFNAVLVGTVLSSLYPALYGGSVDNYELWIFIIIGAIFTVPIQNGVGNIVSSIKSDFTVVEVADEGKLRRVQTKLGLVAFTFPFNIVAFISFVSLALKTYNLKQGGLSEPTPPPQSPELDWLMVAKGGILSVGQVYAINHFVGSLLIIVGLFVFSPILGLSSVIGGYIGTLTGAFLLHGTGESYEAVYEGVYGYNSVLTAGAIGGFFCVLTPRSAFKSLLAAICTAIVQRGLGPTFFSGEVKLPVMTVPFVLTSWVFLLMTTKSSNSMPRVGNISVPERHLSQHYKMSKQSRALVKNSFSIAASMVTGNIMKDEP